MNLEKARADHPSLRKIVVLEHLPRVDYDHYSTLSSLYNTTLRNLVAAATAHDRCEIVVAGHTALLPATQDPAIRSALFGSPTGRGTDGIHFRGHEGRNWHTSSVVTALKSAGLGAWKSQGPRGAARQPADRTYRQVVGTSNQFQV